MLVKVYSMEYVLYNNTAKQVSIISAHGALSALDRHAQCITQVAPGKLIIDEYTMDTNGGYAKIEADKITILLT